MAVGKNKLELGVRIWVDNEAGTAVDLTCDLVAGSVPEVGIVREEIDMTGVCNDVANALAGRGTAGSSLKFFMNDSATGAFTHFNALSLNKPVTVTVQYGANGAAPTTGAPEWEGEYINLGFKVNMDGGKAVLETDIKPTGATAPAWGTMA